MVKVLISIQIVTQNMALTLQPKIFIDSLYMCIFVLHLRARIENIMKIQKILIGLTAAFFVSFLMTSCLNDDNLIPPNCYDGEVNNGEEEIDCGGPCPACDPCLNGLWNPENGETWVDCGGDCGECDPCYNGCQDGGEVGVDCGGICGPCADLCDDGLPNGTEDGADPDCIAPNMAEADCGGDYCDACPTCIDGLMNGTEWGVDCGGICGPCPDDSNCINNIQDGGELYLNCGGPTCPTCQDTLYWTSLSQHTGQGFMSIAEAGGTYTINGTSLTGESIQLVLGQPIGGWVTGTVLTANDLVLTSIVTYTDILGTVYATPVAGSSVTINIENYVAAPDGIFLGSFSGTVVSAGGELRTINQGFFLFNLP
jgi:hypothetical protein